jgi:hypothetical protein
MRDVLENLAKLPPACAAMMAGRKVHITRGARNPIPLSTPVTIDQWNAQHGVTEAQVKAMIVGVTLGWEMDGADPDTHAAASDDAEIGGPFEYTYQAEICVNIVIEARSEELAAQEAKMRLQEVCDWLESGDPIPGQVVGYSPSDTLDLVETDDPRP